MDNEIKNNELNMEELENVNGGLQQASNLLYTGKEKKKTSNALFDGKKKKASNLLYKEEKSSFDGKELSGDVLGKGTYC